MGGAETLRMLCEKAQNMNKASAQERKELFKKIDAEYARVEAALEKLTHDA